jgi:hypothetical protein
LRLDEWRKAAVGEDDKEDHLVLAAKHKTAKSTECFINFHGDMWTRSVKYVALYEQSFLTSGYLFPEVSKRNPMQPGRMMNESEFNKHINRLWAEHRAVTKDICRCRCASRQGS